MCIEVIILVNGNKFHGRHGITIKRSRVGNISVKRVFINRPGKANALNIGIAMAHYDLIAILDADSTLGPNALAKVCGHFKDPNIAAVGSRIKIANTKLLVGKIQRLEYLKVFGISRKLFNQINADALISGAFGVFRKSVLIDLDGYRTNTVGEDMDLVLRIQRRYHNKKHNIIAYESNAICRTDGPRNLLRLLRQRDRWQRGLLDSLIYSRRLILNPRYGLLGMLVLPLMIVFELLGPVIILASVLNLIGLIHEQWILIVGVLLETALSIYVDFKEHPKKKTLKRVLKVTLLTFCGFVLQIILCVARLWGMLSYHWRKLKW